jgi:hypothetical protein
MEEDAIYDLARDVNVWLQSFKGQADSLVRD